LPSKSPAENKSEQIAADIRDAIRSGQLHRGVLYSSRELGERFGASRTPVREALLRLADLGLVRIERNRGARVLGPDGRGSSNCAACGCCWSRRRAGARPR